MPGNYRKRKRNPRCDDVTMLQKVSRSSGGHNAKKSITRRKFLEAYEKTYGNISASCEIAGISRQTLYRWMKSKTEVNLKFRKDLTAIRPKEKLKDLAEAVIVHQLNLKNLDAAKYILDRIAKDRGYGKQIFRSGEFEQVVKAVERLQKIVEVQSAKDANWKFDLRKYAEVAAEDFKVPVEAIEKEFLKRHPQYLEN